MAARLRGSTRRFNPIALGIAVAEDLLAQGAGEILAALYAEETPVT